MKRHSIEPKDCKFVKGHGFVFFAMNIDEKLNGK